MVMEGGDIESCCSSRASEASPAEVASRKQRPKVEVYQEVLRHLRESDCEGACEPGFEDHLWSHFSRLPVRISMVMVGEYIYGASAIVFPFDFCHEN
ncbi:hypothetical protein L6452_34140 [Arctium lappa]|uniref:Uncharacterized protein n=1 Tax=Arctium lappa TaxID=4217 RepID=A0ACB8YIJ4_ARCLA|nr:hypothetical protein L6452_34140 [Arctium lappa]